MATLGELRKKLAKLKKEGASTQTKGRVQYQINQILKKDKGKTIKTKSGTVKTKSGAVRQKDTSKKVASKAKKKVVTKSTGPTSRPNHAKNKPITKSTGPTSRPHHAKNKPIISAAPWAKITEVNPTPSKGTARYDFDPKADYSKVPRIKGILPPKAVQSGREQLEAFRRRLGI